MTEVVAALIWQGERFMACQRPAHKARGLLWEFVGGKVEPGETKEEALARECREELDATGVAYEYLDFSENLKNLKEFLAIRDGNNLFDSIRQDGKIGIPCIVREDGSVTLDWEEFM